MELDKLILKKENYGGLDEFDGSYFGCTKSQLQNLVQYKGELARKELVTCFGDTQQLCTALKTSEKFGLDVNDKDDLRKRKAVFGSNKLESRKSKFFLWFVWEALQDQTLVILMIAAFVSIVLAIYEETHTSAAQFEDAESGLIEGLGILLAVVVIVVATASINLNRDRQFRDLQNRLNEQLKCCVIRGGMNVEIPTFDVMVGEVCQLNTGDVIPADGFLLSSSDLKVDESCHTGESEEVHKSSTSDPVLLSGTHVIEGTCKMLAVAVGETSQKGVIFSLLDVTYTNVGEPQQKRSILQSKLCQITKYVTYAGTILAALTFAILVTRFCVDEYIIAKKPWESGDLQSIINFLIIGITLLAVAIPEGLPLAVILALAYSIKKMMRDNNLVRHLDSCETMGSATIICSDKTGTLTTNRMTVVSCYVAGNYGSAEETVKQMNASTKDMLARCISINSSTSTMVDGFSSTGSKTECALLNFVTKLGYNYRDLQNEEQVKVYTFNSQRKWMGTVMKPSDGELHRLMVKGAAEIILEKCTHVVGVENGVEKMEKGEENLRAVVDKMAAFGLRTLCLAYRDINPDNKWDWDDEPKIINQLTFLALVGIEDPVRPEVPKAISDCRRAGVEVCMVTGDHLLTAKYIARKCGLIKDEDNLALTGEEFKQLIADEDKNFDQERFDLVWPKLKVLARATPRDKFTLVSGLMTSNINGKKQVVAVTGDGTNDAPALKKAHVGLCMGISGTDVAKEASDIILIDDNFTSIVKSVMWGRHVHDSIAKFIQFQLTINIVSVVLVLLGASILSDSPLRGVQMLWVNLLMDTLASLSLATEEPTDDLLKRKPYGIDKPIISRIMLTNILGHAAYQFTFLSIILWKGYEWLDVEPGFSAELFGKANVHYTFLFNTFVMMILFNEINSRKIDASINVFAGILKSPIFLIIWFASFAVQIVLIQLGSTVFSTVPLSITQWLWCIFVGVSELLFAQVISLIMQMEIYFKRSSKDDDRKP